MQTKKLLGVVTLSMITSVALYATNGDTLIGVGAKTRSMGGAGIAFSHGSESTLVNPALITHINDNEISFGGTVFMPDISTDIRPYSGGKKDSDADISIIPAVALSSKIGENLYIGTGMWGTAGMGTDFRDYNSLFNMETTLQLMQFAVPVAYKMEGLSIGVAPIVQYGSLDIHYVMGTTTVSPGQSQDFGFGGSVGLTYDFDNGLTIGAVYKSEIKMSYKNVLSEATAPFQALPNFPEIGDTLEQPAEYGIGLGYTYGPHSIAIDYKKIAWSSATGYEQFGWEDQNVFAIGYQYEQDSWSIRVGYNHASNPLSIYNGSGMDMAGAALNMFNLLGFPATAENHYTIGATYEFSDTFSMDFTAVYAPEVTTSADISALQNIGMTGIDSIENDHSELGITIQLNYKF